MAAHAAHGLRLPALVIEQADAPPGSPLELSCPRPDSTLKTRVTRSEFDVVRAFVEGASHASIAERYRCSPRTIANHLGSVFRKLRVSGRAELLSCLIREHAA
jgi:DNA-binding CsgD family transcriptional regulator